MKTIKELEEQIAALQEKKKSLARVQIVKDSFDKPFRQMSKDEKFKAALCLPSLPSNLIDVLNDNGFLTGTSVYGRTHETDPADIDWVVNVPPSVFEGFAIGIDEDNGYWETDGMSTLYAHHNRVIYNIICISDIDLFNAWYMTTEIMKALEDLLVQRNVWRTPKHYACREAFKTKWKRVRVFRALRDVLYPVEKWQKKDQLPKQEALDHYKCRICRQEAINFSCATERVKYQETGVCERCRCHDVASTLKI